MADLTSLIIAFAAGLALGVFYFRGLWYTVKKLPDAGRPFLTAAGSFALRASVVLAGFYLVMGGNWERLVAALLGFILTREFLVRRLGAGKMTSFKGALYGNRGH
jgi:F1F0 ATPase subunit 2